jgi:hypothetical protein
MESQRFEGQRHELAPACEQRIQVARVSPRRVPADIVVVDQRDPRAGTGQEVGRARAENAGADDNDVCSCSDGGVREL